MKFSEKTLRSNGGGDRDVVVVGFGGTIMMDARGKGEGGVSLRVPCGELGIHLVRETFKAISAEERDRIRNITLMVADPVIDSANARFKTLVDCVMSLRKIQDERNPDAILTFSGTDTFEYLQAALWQGMPKDRKTVIVSTCSMRPPTHKGLTDALLNARNAFQLCLDDRMREESDGTVRGRMAAVVNGGYNAYPAGTLKKEDSTFDAFVSRGNRLFNRTLTLAQRVERATEIRQGKTGPERVYRPEKLLDGNDKWTYKKEGTPRPPRESDYPQGDASIPFELVDSIRTDHMTPANDYSCLYNWYRLAKREKKLPSAARTLNALIAAVPGGTTRDDDRSQKFLIDIADTLAVYGIPVVVGGTIWSKQQRPATEPPKLDDIYSGDPRLIGGNVGEMTGCMPAEREILLGRLLARGAAEKLTGKDLVAYVLKNVEIHMGKWR